MFKRILNSQRSSIFGKGMQRRAYQTNHGKTYMSSMERTVQDKFNWTFMGKIPIYALLGGLNLAAYGLSLFMTKEDYLEYFAYRGGSSSGDGSRATNLPRAMIGSNNFMNAAESAGLMIVLGGYMHSKVGAMTMLKLAGLSCLGIAMSW